MDLTGKNLFFQVDKPKNKEQYILKYISEHSGDSGIIYCATRKNVDNVYELLKSKGISVGKYHAGMSAGERKKMQDDFVFDYTSIVVATNAFGMGIDKSNVRFVIHYNMPQSMENYYQEAGRAGRDGLDAKCILLFSPQDIVINRFLLDHKEMQDLDPADREDGQGKGCPAAAGDGAILLYNRMSAQLYFKVFRGKSGKNHVRTAAIACGNLKLWI